MSDKIANMHDGKKIFMSAKHDLEKAIEYEEESIE